MMLKIKYIYICVCVYYVCIYVYMYTYREMADWKYLPNTWEQLPNIWEQLPNNLDNMIPFMFKETIYVGIKNIKLTYIKKNMSGEKKIK